MLVRHPRIGEVKTRIAEQKGDRFALELHTRLARHTLRRLLALSACREARVEVRTDAAFVQATRELLGRGPSYRYQGEGDLGDRLRHSFAEAFGRGDERVVVVGSDCPRLETRHLREALAHLDRFDVVMGPAADGGYYLIGCRRDASARVLPVLFNDMPWGSSDVYTETTNRARQAGLSTAALEELPDVDVLADLADAELALAAEDLSDAAVSVVVPAIDEEASIEACVERALAAGASEVIVADGGSLDATRARAQSAGARVVSAPRGRGTQLNAGAAAARGEVLCFLHADTRLPPDSATAVRAALARPRAVAAAFDFAVAGTGWRRRLVGMLGRLRWRLGGLPYGDQALCVPKWVFESLGGFAEIPTMEDYEFAQRLRRYGRTTRIKAAAETSPRVWDEFGLVYPSLVNLAVITGFRLGVDAERLAAWRQRISPRTSRARVRREGE